MTTSTPTAPTNTGQAPVKQLRKGMSTKMTLLLLVLPSLFLLVLINLYPFIYAFFQSLHDGSLIATGPFVGLSNYKDVLTSSAFWKAAWFTLIFTIVGVFGSWLIGLGLALLLRTKIPGNTVFKVLLMLPWVVPIVVSSTAWNWLVATPDSLIPSIFRNLGLGTPLFLRGSSGRARLIGRRGIRQLRRSVIE